MVTSVEDYNKLVNETEVVKLESGREFAIKKKVSTRLMLPKFLPLISDVSKNRVEKNQILWEKMSPQDKQAAIDLADFKIVLAVAEPKLSMEKEQGAIWIKDVTDEDYRELQVLTEKISYGQEILDPLLEKGGE